MTKYSKCPECGETNYYRDAIGSRVFDCGFECNSLDRTNFCENENKNERHNTEYRQALIHFSRALDAITEDMQKDGGPVDYIVKYKMLARDALNLADADKEAITYDSKWSQWAKTWGLKDG